MNEMIRKRNEQLAKTVIKGLQSRNMSGYYAEDKEAALKQALELIPEGSTIAMGGCMSAGEIGLISALEAGNYHYIDRSKMDWPYGTASVSVLTPYSPTGRSFPHNGSARRWFRPEYLIRKILMLCCMIIRICQNFKSLQTRKALKNMVEVKCILHHQSTMTR